MERVADCDFAGTCNLHEARGEVDAIANAFDVGTAAWSRKDAQEISNSKSYMESRYALQAARPDGRVGVT